MSGREILIGSRDVSDAIFTSALTALSQQVSSILALILLSLQTFSNLAFSAGGVMIDGLVDKILNIWRSVIASFPLFGTR